MLQHTRQVAPPPHLLRPRPAAPCPPAEKLRKLAQDGYKRFEGFEYDVEADIKAYQDMAATVKPFIADTVHQINQWCVTAT